MIVPLGKYDAMSILGTCSRSLGDVPLHVEGMLEVFHEVQLVKIRARERTLEQGISARGKADL